jgi:hypothetical protein
MVSEQARRTLLQCVLRFRNAKAGGSDAHFALPAKTRWSSLVDPPRKNQTAVATRCLGGLAPINEFSDRVILV